MELPMKVKATKTLKEDHAKVQALFQQFRETEAVKDRTSLAESIFKDLESHFRLEEGLIYPNLPQALVSDPVLQRLGEEHSEVKRLISEFRLCADEDCGPASERTGRFFRLMARVQDHIAEEEGQALPLLEADPDLDEELGLTLAKLKLKLNLFPPIHHHIDLDVPARVAYNQWTQFETFPHFLDNVTTVQQLDAAHVRWQVEVGGKDVQWTAEIYEQIPDQRIAWRSIDGAVNAGSVSFAPLTLDTSRMLVEIAYEPQGLLEDLGAMMGLLSHRVATELKKFKDYIETHAQESGAWRGKIEGSPVQQPLPGMRDADQ